MTGQMEKRAAPRRLLAREEVGFSGHAMVRATHSRTIEITTEAHLSPRGDCIIGVGAAKGISGLSPRTKRALRRDRARVEFTIVAPGGEFSFGASGSADLTFENESDMVIRTSGFVCGRTLAVGAEASALSIPRAIVGSLKSPTARGVLRIEVYA